MATSGGTGTCIVVGERIARYAFGDGHPFGSDRHDAFTRDVAGLASFQTRVNWRRRVSTAAC